MYTKIIIPLILTLQFCFSLSAQSTLQLADGGKIEADNSIGVFINSTCGLFGDETFTVSSCYNDLEFTTARSAPVPYKLFELTSQSGHSMWGGFQIYGDLTVHADESITSGGHFNSTGGYIFNLDYNDNAPNHSFLIKNSAGTNVLRVREDGESFSKSLTTQGDLTVEDTIFSKKGLLSTPQNFRLVLDDDNSFGFDPYFTISDGSSTMFSVGGFGPAELNQDLDVNGNLHVNGSLSKNGGTFRIDHPLDPENKYLYHSFIESPDMMNIYNGNAKTDAEGFATIELPEYFEALNVDFRYQLTVLETFADAIVKEKISDNIFIIQTSKPNVEVSWQVTGIRNDTWARENRVEVEVDKQKLVP